MAAVPSPSVSQAPPAAGAKPLDRQVSSKGIARHVACRAILGAGDAIELAAQRRWDSDGECVGHGVRDHVPWSVAHDVV